MTTHFFLYWNRQKTEDHKLWNKRITSHILDYPIHCRTISASAVAIHFKRSMRHTHGHTHHTFMQWRMYHTYPYVILYFFFLLFSVDKRNVSMVIQYGSNGRDVHTLQYCSEIDDTSLYLTYHFLLFKKIKNIFLNFFDFLAHILCVLNGLLIFKVCSKWIEKKQMRQEREVETKFCEWVTFGFLLRVFASNAWSWFYVRPVVR